MSSKLDDYFANGEVFDARTSLDNPAENLEDAENDEEFFKSVMEQSKMECLAIPVDATYHEGTPFEYLGKQMFDLTGDGKVKKRILIESKGIKPNSGDYVSIHYNGYIEFQAEPFDSTYARKRPHRFDVDKGSVIPGLDCAVRSMRVKEKSQFLIHSDYAYRNLLIGRIPPNANVLFEVELLDVFDKSGIRDFEKLKDDKSDNFDVIYKYCETMCEKAKRSVMQKKIKPAIRDYNTALGVLMETIVHEPEHIKRRREMQYRLHSNLAVCYFKNEQPRKTIREVLDIYKLTDNGEILPIGAKIYYHHAKCLRVLGEYDEANAVLQKALKRCPKSTEIAEELIALSKEAEAYKKKQEKMAKAMVASSGCKK